jgi:hypothetical protein
VPPNTLNSRRKIERRGPDEQKRKYVRKKTYNICQKCKLPIYKVEGKPHHRKAPKGKTGMYCPNIDKCSFEEWCARL